MTEVFAAARSAPKGPHPLLWVATAYVAEGIPFAMVIWVAGTMFKDMGHSDARITVATASIGIVWSLKPLWAGFLDLLWTKKSFVIVTQLTMAGMFALAACALHLDSYFSVTIIVLWGVAFASATQDICVDGVYITTLDERQQAAYIGLQGMAWNLGRVIAVSLTVWLAGYLRQDVALELRPSWSIVLGTVSGLMLLLAIYHSVFLPTGSQPVIDGARSVRRVLTSFRDSALDFCGRPYLWGMLSFVLFFRSAEGLLLVEAPLFLQGCLEDGGLQLSLKAKGFIDGTVGTVANIAGGLLGGLFVSRFTLRNTLFILALCVNVPNLVFIYLAHAAVDGPPSVDSIAVLVGIEKFWYGFGFIGNMLYMMQQLAPGRYKMTHYAFATALMNLVLVPTQMVSGPLADAVGFIPFFWIVLVASIPSLIAAWFAPFPYRGARAGAPDDRRGAHEGDPDARRATVRSLLALGLFLYVDTLALGWLGTTDSVGLKAALLVALTVSVWFKFSLALAAFGAGRRARRRERTFRGGNARGAMAAAGGVIVVSLAVVAVVVHQASAIDWSCLEDPTLAQCAAESTEATPRACRASRGPE